MDDQNFTTTLVFDQTPDEVFAAINNVRDWWTGEIEGDTGGLGDEFVYRSGDDHRSTQKITGWVPGKKVVWRVLESQINFVADKTEWNDTEIVFEIARKAGKTELRFTHVGLVPAKACYGDCSEAWRYFINDRLRNLIAAGN